jgi:hypothetical protein
MNTLTLLRLDSLVCCRFRFIVNTICVDLGGSTVSDPSTAITLRRYQLPESTVAPFDKTIDITARTGPELRPLEMQHRKSD